MLPRPKFGFAVADVAHALRVAEQETVRVVAHPLSFGLADPSDLPFAEVAVAGAADALVTGNIKDYQIRGGGKLDIAIVTPRQFLNLLARR